MIDPKIESALKAALTAFSNYNKLDSAPLIARFQDVFASDEDFLSKADMMDEVFDDNPNIESLREVFFDLLMVNFFSADVKKLEEDYLESQEWEEIEEETLDRGTELLNLLLYLNECEDEDIEPELSDYLKEFLLVDEDEFQDEYRIYEPVIQNQILMESPVSEISRVSKSLPGDSEIKEIFYPMMCFFHGAAAGEYEKEAIAVSAIEKDFDMAVLEVLISFN
jgi:hypothetical protein